MVFFFDYNRRLRLPAAFKPRADVREYPGRRPTPKSAKRVRAGHPARRRLLSDPSLLHLGSLGLLLSLLHRLLSPLDAGSDLPDVHALHAKLVVGLERLHLLGHLHHLKGLVLLGDGHERTLELLSHGELARVGVASLGLGGAAGEEDEGSLVRLEALEVELLRGR